MAPIARVTEIGPIKLSGLSSLFVEFPYSPELVSLMKGFSPAIWHKKLKGWEVSALCLHSLLDELALRGEVEFRRRKNSEIGEISQPPLTEEEIANFRVAPFRHQVEAVDFMLEKGRSLLLESMGLGKEEPVDSLIPTPRGFKRMGDIAPGDFVFGSDGKPHEVLRTYPHKGKDIYRVAFSDGAERFCGAEHLWKVRTPLMRARKKGWKVLSTEDIVKAGVHYGGYPKHGKWEIPMCRPVEYPEKEYFVHPYILGMLLGDGCLVSSTPLLSIPDSDPDAPNRVRGFMRPGYSLNKIERKDEGCPQYSLANDLNSRIGEDGRRVGSGMHVENRYAQECRRLGINVKSGEKFIPEEYKLGSVQQRLDLLRGLMDTDGSISKAKNKISFDSTSKRLAEDLMEIARSLGMVAKLRVHRRDRSGEGRSAAEVSYQVRLNPTVCPFYLERKAARYTKTSTKYLSRYIASIEKVGVSDTQCITVDSEDHCYLTGREYVVTHNTAEMIMYAETLKNRGLIDHCLVVCGVNAVKLNFAKEIGKFSKESCRVLGMRVAKTGTVSYGSVKDRIDELNKPIREFFVVTNIETLRNDSVIKAISSGPNRFGLILLDEAHRALSGNVSNDQASNLRKLKAPYKVAATGTLITNSPLSAFGPLSWTENDHATLTNFKGQYCEFGGFNGYQIVGFKDLELLQEELESCSIRRTFEEVRGDMPPKTVEFETVEMDEAHRKFYEAIKAGVKEEADKVELKAGNLLALTTRLRQATAAPSVLTSNPVESSKVKRCAELVEELASQGEKVVVLSNFVEPVYRLAEMLKGRNPLVNTGDVEDAVVAENVEKFNEDPSALVFLGTHAKAGTGISLPAARYMIMLDTPWTYAQFGQSSDRIYRITSNQAVYIRVLSCADTIDERVIEIIRDKKELSDYLVDGKPSQSFSDELRKILRDL